MEPQIAYEVNATKYTRVALGASLRILTGGGHSFPVRNSKLNAVSATLAVKVGKFRY